MYILLLFFSLLKAPTPQLQITNIAESRGNLRIAIYNKAEGFLDPAKAWHLDVIPVRKNGVLEITLPQAPAGWYAVSCYHDLNGNGKLDQNLLGIPTEPYGFSNNARPQFRAPVWEEARIWYQPGKAQTTVRLEKW